jgi:hypothetical protein
MVDRGAPPRAEGLAVGQEFGPQEEMGSHRQARESGAFSGRLRTFGLHRGAPFACTASELGHARHHNQKAR